MIQVLIWARSPFTQAGLQAAISADPRFEIVGKLSHSAETEPGLAGFQEDVILFDGLEGDIDELLSVSIKVNRSRRIVLLAEDLTRAEAVHLMQSGVQAVRSAGNSAARLLRE